jgi:hypothetical protein
VVNLGEAPCSGVFWELRIQQLPLLHMVPGLETTCCATGYLLGVVTMEGCECQG